MSICHFSRILNCMLIDHNYAQWFLEVKNNGWESPIQTSLRSTRSILTTSSDHHGLFLFTRSMSFNLTIIGSPNMTCLFRFCTFYMRWTTLRLLVQLFWLLVWAALSNTNVWEKYGRYRTYSVKLFPRTRGQFSSYAVCKPYPKI